MVPPHASSPGGWQSTHIGVTEEDVFIPFQVRGPGDALMANGGKSPRDELPCLDPEPHRTLISINRIEVL